MLPLWKIFRPFLLMFLLLNTPSPANGVRFGQWQTLLSLASSLMNRVATVRESRGDFEGAERARKIAENLGGVFGFLGRLWSVTLDYLKNYVRRDFVSGWRRPAKVLGVVSDMNELLAALNEMTQMDREEKATWISNNYQRVLAVSNSLISGLLVVFSRSGPLREVILILQEEAEGDLLQDCLELGANDLKRLIQVAKDIFVSHIYSAPNASPDPHQDL